MDQLTRAYPPPARIDLALEPDFQFGALRIRPARRVVEAAGARHVLQRRVMQVLVALAHSNTEVVSQQELILRCWDGLAVSDDAIGRCIAQLRRLAASWAEPPFEIETIAGVGYRLAATSPGGTGPQSPAALPRHRQAWIVVAGAVLIAAATLWAVRDRLPFAAAPPPLRVAVLPFDVLGGGGGAQSFADGLQDEILGVLSSDQVRALSRTDSLALRGPSAQPAIRRLGVGLFLDGTVREQGGVIKVRASLNDAGDHTTVWSHDFTAPAARAEALQAQVAARTTDVAHWALVARSAPSPLDPASLAAFVAAGDQLDNVGNEANPLLRQVIAKSPDFARAHSLLAIGLTDNAASDDNPNGAPSAARAAEAKSEAQKALQLDPKSGEAYLAIERATPIGAWREREAWLARGLTVEPDLPYLSYFQSQFLGQVGRFRDALAFAERAAELNPLFGGINISVCARLTYLGRTGQARAACERADRLWPGAPINDITQFYLDAGEGRDKEAIKRLLSPAISAYFGPVAVRDWGRFLRARAIGNLAAARAAALAAAGDADAGAVDRRDAYLALALAGEIDAALQQADRFYTPERMRIPAGGTSLDTSLLFVPATASVRRDPRFLLLAAKIGLGGYWRATGKWPDFCADPGLPYDCRAEAHRLAGKVGA